MLHIHRGDDGLRLPRRSFPCDLQQEGGLADAPFAHDLAVLPFRQTVSELTLLDITVEEGFCLGDRAAPDKRVRRVWNPVPPLRQAIDGDLTRYALQVEVTDPFDRGHLRMEILLYLLGRVDLSGRTEAADTRGAVRGIGTNVAVR